jgi:hypothetical protein
LDLLKFLTVLYAQFLSQLSSPPAMSTSIVGLYFRPIDLARGATAAVSLLGIVVGARGLLNPFAYASAFGFPSITWAGSTAETNPWVRVTSVRVLSSGLALFTCNYLKCDRAVGVMLVSGFLTGLVDGLMVTNYSTVRESRRSSSGEQRRVQEEHQQAAKHAAWGHWTITTVSAAVGAWMIAQS